MEKPQYNLRSNPELNLATARSKNTKKWHNQRMNWSELLSKLSSPTITSETSAQWAKMTKDKQHEIKDVGGFVGGWLKEGRRKAENVQNRSILTLDADFPNHNLWEDIQMLFDESIAVYSTHAFTKDNPRMRLIIPLARAVTADEYVPLARKVAEQFGMNNFDDTTYQPERLMFWPSVSKNGQFIFEYQDGDLLSPDKVLGEYDDWRDSSFWPISSRETEVHEREAKQQGDPLTKPGIIGAFNRTYDIKTAIDMFLTDVYAPGRHDDRYTFIQGTTSEGLVLYDDKFAYSNHGTDPASGELCSAFDLVRIQKFHDLDVKTKPGTVINKLPSYKAMNDFALKDKSVRAEWQKSVTGSAVDDFSDPVEGEEVTKDELEDWLEYTDSGQPVVNNYLLAQHLLADLPIFYNGNEFLRYDETVGIWKNDAEEYLKSLMIKKYLVKLSKTNYLRETNASIQGLALTGEPFIQADISHLVLANGVYDVETNKFVSEFSPQLHARVNHPVEYDPEADCPTFDQYLEWAVGEENKDFMYQWIGYLFYRDYPIQKMLFLLGPGGTGKSTLIEVMRALVGDDAYSAVTLEALMTNSFATSGLYQKTANFDADAKPEYLNDGSLLKTLTGEDMIYGDIKYEKPIKFYNFAKLTFAMNSMPAMRDFTGGLKRRAIIIPVRNVVTDEVKRKYPLRAIMKELPGIFNKAMDGLRQALKDRKFIESESAKHELNEWIRGNDQVGRFIEESCRIGDDALTSTGEDLYNAYTEYASDAGEKTMGKYRLFQRLEELGYKRERKREKGQGNPKRLWIGIRSKITDFD
ncbi:DNA primase family protein [Lapidilactobacillus bayanensis]|uniref:DNA primase family protein n=1 Tax=Lapidilactobacillus bayanensis TaxID=2485998 RepID=UPI00384AE80C